MRELLRRSRQAAFLGVGAAPRFAGAATKSDRFVAVVVLLALASRVSPALGRADTAVLPADLGLPWTDPAHWSPLEQLLAPIASKIAGRPVAERCEGDNDWGILAAQGKFDPAAEAGYVTSPRHRLRTNTFVSSPTTMELSPAVVCIFSSSPRPR